MKLNWRKSYADERPQDVTFGKNTIYLHKNIEEIEIEDMDEKRKSFMYDEAALSKAEYAQYLAEKNKADIDYICLETGVEL